MKKYTFTLTVEEITFSNTVNNIIEKVREEKRIEALIEQNNNSFRGRLFRFNRTFKTIRFKR
jgi:IS1 family transposase